MDCTTHHECPERCARLHVIRDVQIQNSPIPVRNLSILKARMQSWACRAEWSHGLLQVPWHRRNVLVWFSYACVSNCPAGEVRAVQRTREAYVSLLEAASAICGCMKWISNIICFIPPMVFVMVECSCHLFHKLFMVQTAITSLTTIALWNMY